MFNLAKVVFYSLKEKAVFARLVSFIIGASGATAIEYALIASLISVFVILSVTAVGVSLTDIYISIGNAMQSG